MDDIRKICLIAGENFSGWRKNPRIYMSFVLAFVLCLMLSGQAVSLSQTYETPLQLLETFIWTFGDAQSVLLSSLLLLLLFGDVPFIHAATPYWLIRTKRRGWLAGQLLYVILATVIYCVFLLVVQMLLASPYAFPGNVWSETAAMLGYGGGSTSVTIPVSLKTMENTTPLECMLQIFLLLLLYSLFMAVLLLFLNLAGGAQVGVLGVLGINLYGFLLNPEVFQKVFHFTGNLEYRANVCVGWLSPLNHATYPMHSFGYDYLPAMGVSVGIFLIFIVLLAGLAWKKMKTYNFSFTQTDE